MEIQRGKDVKQADHEKLDIIMFGEAYTEIHQWLDELWDDYAWGGKNEEFGNAYYHWSERHHKQACWDKIMPKDGKGVRYVSEEGMKKWEAAKLHIISDWLTHWGCPELPDNKEEVIKLLDKKLGLK